MARLSPLVLVSGELRRLQAGDSLSGACSVFVGSGSPDNANGNDGDLYINSIQGDISVKQAGSWTFYGANAYFFQGKALDSSVIAPSNGNILVYDSSLFSGVGGWKVSAPGGASFSSMDDETRARLNLAIL